MNNKTILMSVTSDLSTDQRVHRSAITLHNEGYIVTVIGRRLPSTFDIERPYKTVRLRLWFTKGALFYITYNLRLCCYLLWHRCDILFANDLDTLLPNYITSKLKNKPLVFDSHEYFTGVPELEGRPFVKGIWKKIEKFIVPSLSYTITVNKSIADLFMNEYRKPFSIVRNIPLDAGIYSTISRDAFRKANGIPADKHVIILQGNGINIHRGAEELVDAMLTVEDAILLIAGHGDVIAVLQQKTRDMHLEQKVIFKPRMSYEMLMQFTEAADLGISFDKPTNINYLYSLPNKLFDYIHAHIPVLASNLPEIERIITLYDIGYTIAEIDPALIADTINLIFADRQTWERKKNNTYFAAEQLTWNNEKKELLAIVQKAAT